MLHPQHVYIYTPTMIRNGINWNQKEAINGNDYNKLTDVASSGGEWHALYNGMCDKPNGFAEDIAGDDKVRCAFLHIIIIEDQ